MCGIAGCFTVHPAETDGEALKRALLRLAHRGPNGRGAKSLGTDAGQLSLGHRRLSIIDLSDAGLQPMTSADGRFTIVFNGEIYNYVELRDELRGRGRTFQTRTDTEVLLQTWAEWGSNALDRLDGMFAFAIYDRVNQTLCCARDPFGIKPLFYSASAKGFAFASEIPALLEFGLFPPRINRARAHAFLCWGDYDDGADTFYENVFHLRPGELMTIDLRHEPLAQPSLKRWWKPEITERTNISFESAADGVRELFLQSVRRQLRSDVAVGATLSGGVDSSAIVCAIRHLEPDFPILTFSYAADCDRLGERKWAQVVNSHVGAVPHWVDDRSDDLFGELDDIIAAQGEPFGSTSIAAGYRVLRLAHDNGVTVTLDGQGADEMLAGYNGYPAAAIRSRLDRHAYGELVRFIWRWKQWPGRSWKWAALHLGDAIVPSELRDAAFRMIGHSPTPAWINEGRLRDSGVIPEPAARLPEEAEGHGRRLAERLRTALTINRLPALLRHGDRNSMRWSIESRVPFLTPDLARFTLALPEDYLLSPNAQTKHVFRHAMRGIMPNAILDRRDKIGFETPERAMLNRSRERVDKWLDAARDVDFLNFEPLRREVHRILDGAAPFSFKAWRIINFCRWIELQTGQIR
ncbi:asparagine synthase (glutamine-hydrolyzing) [Sphingosinicella humi]|uniref:asparagine synthase (glutamine-hydrolyzing) n=1 Tax=Allosphingosinicella humi TaxID=2068657 RepID=A0A2U2J181_9SPHN|nr:asparagine synthase (glutamine-hydrolyzing) [Sphingosinicella humi]PWG02100.1 asparagine synthase (glutamine-hydrolyzing) [Sphingosinicella humi]